MRRYYFPIIIEQDKDGFFVSCPSLQGCYSQGDTYQEALDNIKEAIELHVEDRAEDKEEFSEIKSVSLATVGVSM